MAASTTRGGAGALPYWRLSAFYLFFFASLGAIVPYWSLYLDSLGFDAVAIGQLMAVVMATKIVAPNLWGWLADRSGQRMRIVRLATAAALIAFCAVFWSDGFWSLALAMTLFSFFWNAALPQFEAETLSALGAQHHRYSRIRMWGSIGFILSVVALGAVLERHGAAVLPAVVVALLAGLWLSTLLVPGRGSPVADRGGPSILSVLRRPPVVVLFVVCFLVQLSHGSYYTFFSIYLEEHGYERGVIGLLWGLGVVAEVGVFLVMHRLLPRFGAVPLLLLALGLTTVRWVLVAAFPGQPALIAAAQLLHAASFGIYHAVAIHLIHRIFVGPHQGRGQALYSSLSFGAGGAAGSLGSGYLWASWGGEASFAAAAVASFLALVLAWAGLRRVDDAGPDEYHSATSLKVTVETRTDGG